MRSNQIAMNAGAGLFAHSEAKATLHANVFKANAGEALAARPSSRTVIHASLNENETRPAAHARAMTPTIVRRQRVPFDWTVGSNVGAEDKSLHERAAEMREQFETMRADKMASGVAMLPSGIDASAACTLQ